MQLTMAVVVTILLLLLVAASRPLEEVNKKKDVHFYWIDHQSLQRGPVTGTGASGCGHTPGRPGNCPLTEMNYDGAGSFRARHSKPPPPTVDDGDFSS
ncbi:hypothetical protein LINPERPRIM_LOCUS19373 [Linum perenne]